MSPTNLATGNRLLTLHSQGCKVVLMTQNGYRIDWTRFVPGGAHEKESSYVRGDLGTVRDYLDNQLVYGLDPIVVTEHTKSDGQGRVVPSSEWDTCE